MTSERVAASPRADTAVTIYLAVLLVLPSDRRIEALGGAGSPSLLIGAGALLWWGWRRLTGRAQNSSPITAALAFFVAAVLASYAVSSMMALPAAERSGADMGLIRLAAMAGVLLTALDGVPCRERFLHLMRRMSLLGGLYASLGLLQFFTAQSLVDGITIPGLVASDVSFGERAGFVRAISTAMHPLETSLVLVMILPLALTLAIYDRKRRPVARWYPVAAILLLSVLSVTRSAILGVGVACAVLFWTWPRAVRQWMGLAILLGAIGVYAAVPGMAGTIIGMFTADDPSLVSRTDSYDMATALVGLSPMFGRGLGMLLPSYRILDNQFLLMLVETGIVGLVGLVALIAAACWAAVSLRSVWRGRDDIMSAFGVALLASMLAGSLLLAFFDAFSFPQASGIFFLTIGLCGGYLRLCAANTSRARKHQGRRPLGLVLGLIAAVAGATALTIPPVHYGRVDVIFLLPAASDDSNELMADPGLTLYLAGIVEQIFNDDHGELVERTTSAPLYGTGLRHGHLVHVPSTGGQWQTSYDRPLISVEVVGASDREVRERLDRYTEDVAHIATTVQNDLAIPSRLHVRTTNSPGEPHVELIPRKTSRAAAALLVITGLAAWTGRSRRALEREDQRIEPRIAVG